MNDSPRLLGMQMVALGVQHLIWGGRRGRATTDSGDAVQCRVDGGFDALDRTVRSLVWSVTVLNAGLSF